MSLIKVLNPDLIAHVALFLDVGSALALSNVNKEVRKERGFLLRDLYKRVFGEINEKEFNEKIFATLLSCTKKRPNNGSVKYNNVYKVPSGYLEKWKWTRGFKNNLDKEVQENYDEAIRLLKNTRAISILHLINQRNCFWHIDRQIKDYEEFRSKEKAQAKKFYYNSVSLPIGKKVDVSCIEIFVKIGEFNLKDRVYNVVAFYPFGINQYFLGRTCIRIVKKGDPCSIASFKNSDPHFSIGMRKKIEDSLEDSSKIFAEKRHLEYEIGYQGGVRDNQGSDRILDQKLTQIMIELLIQNKGMNFLRVNTTYDDLPVLIASGFQSDKGVFKRIMEELQEFRAIEGNKLFPPSRNYGHNSTAFFTRDLNRKNVFYEGVPKSWLEIIEKEPILNPNTAIIPEYLAIRML